jgi:hypothetical protein
VSVKLLVWALLGFGVYAAYSYSPAYLTHSQVEGAVQNVLEHGNHKLKDETILAKALTAAESVEFSLSEDEIEISREQHEGERIIHVEFDIPVAVSFLGQRTVIRHVHARQVYQVDEAAEARFAARQQQKARHKAKRRAQTRERVADYQQSIKDECAKHSKGDFVATHVTVTHGDGSMRTIECSTAYAW